MMARPSHADLLPFDSLAAGRFSLQVRADRVQYLEGSALSSVDLHRAAMNSAVACFVLSSREAKNEDAEDAATILRVKSVLRLQVRADMQHVDVLWLA